MLSLFDCLDIPEHGKCNLGLRTWFSQSCNSGNLPIWHQLESIPLPGLSIFICSRSQILATWSLNFFLGKRRVLPLSFKYLKYANETQSFSPFTVRQDYRKYWFSILVLVPLKRRTIGSLPFKMRMDFKLCNRRCVFMTLSIS